MTEAEARQIVDRAVADYFVPVTDALRYAWAADLVAERQTEVRIRRLLACTSAAMFPRYVERLGSGETMTEILASEAT